MGTDILYRKSFVHIILTDVVFDQKNSWIFLRSCFGFREIFFCFGDQGLMKLRKCETVINCFGDTFNISGTGNLLLVAGIFQA